jgi:hypothetical protein
MNASVEHPRPGDGRDVGAAQPRSKPRRPVDLRSVQLRQFILITLVAAAIYVTMRMLPTGTNLNHTDFRVQGTNSIEFCDASNPQFIPVVAVRSPVIVTLQTTGALAAGQPVRAIASFRTATGKPIAPADLLVVHTQLMHLLIVDPSLTDYQHVHPTPGKVPGDWSFSFTPRFGGTYRIFADFTPIATGRGLYASTDLEISGTAARREAIVSAPTSANASDAIPPAPGGRLLGSIERDGFRYTLTATNGPIQAKQAADLVFRIAALEGGRVPLGTVMGAYAHLVGFDVNRSGFAHLHPAQADPLTPPDAVHPTLDFKLTIPTAGQYVIWAQVNLAGREVFVPFWFRVE